MFIFPLNGAGLRGESKPDNPEDYLNEAFERQGYGTEYLNTNGVWHHTSTLEPQNPGYNAEAAANTHIPVP